MKLLLLGSTGMLGQTLYRNAKKKGYMVTGVARSGADRIIDVRSDSQLREVLYQEKPDVIINSAAITNLEYCEKNPEQAYLTNTRPAGILAEIARDIDAQLVHISTDHFFTGDGSKKHKETHPVTLVNEYARSKYLAECFVKLYDRSLIVRTNIVGFRGFPDNPTFIEWCIQMLEEKKSAVVYEDYFTSSIDTNRFSGIILDLIERDVKGVLNVASRDVSSKKEFINLLAMKIGLDISHAQPGSIQSLKEIPRAESLGLDVSKAEDILGYSMPGVNQVIKNLVDEYQNGIKNE
jgi:dTDP-4-dehydrorhamnose reductase